MIEQMNDLKNIRKEGSDKIFTMYLNTDASDPDQKGGKWRIQLKNSLQNFTSYLEADGNKEELENFNTVKDKVERYMEEAAQDLSRGIIVFASADDLWFAHQVQMHLDSEFHWETEPQLEQLQQLKETFPETGTILVQQNEIKVIEAFLNEVEKIHHYELNLDTENWTEKKGPRKGVGGSNMQKDMFKRKFSANQQRWYKSIAPKLDKLAKDGGWENIYLIGEREAVQEIKHQMNKEVDDVIFKNMLDHEASEVLQAVSG